MSEETKMWCNVGLKNAIPPVDLTHTIAATRRWGEAGREQVFLLAHRSDGYWGWYCIATAEWFEQSGWGSPHAAVTKAREEGFTNICNINIVFNALTPYKE